MHNKAVWIGIAALLGAIVALAGIAAPAAAQSTSLPSDEPDTEQFIAQNFILQDSYSRVLCVSGDGTCPAEITIAVPHLIAAHDFAPQTYSVAAMFDTIQAGADSAQPGDLIIIMPGRYAGVEIEATGGADGAYIHFLGWGDRGSVIVDGPADPSKSYLRHHFYFIDAHHYIIQNIAFEGAEGAGVFVSGYFAATGHFSHHFIVLGIYSHDNGYWGLHTTATNTVLIQDSRFTTSREEHGVYISGSGDDMVIRRNLFQGNAAGGLQVNADPQTATEEIYYWLAESTGDTCGISEDDVWITEWQTVKDCYDAQGLPDLGAYIEDGISENLIIEQNIVTDNGATGGGGINLASVRHSTVRNNLIYGNHAAGIACWDNAYAEEKELASSDFGCQDVRILNNTIVDETGDRGALILNQDARDMTVINNIIVRDRFDAYEITGRSGSGLVSYANAYSALNIEDSPGVTQIDTDPGSGSITGFSVADALDQFLDPGFVPWMRLDLPWPVPRDDRPDFRLRPDSAWAGAGAPPQMELDLFSGPRVGNALGALNPFSKGDTASRYQSPRSPRDQVPTSNSVGEGDLGGEAAGIGARQTDPIPPTITYRLTGENYDGHIYRVLAEPGAEPESLTLALDALAPRSGDPAINIVDEWVNISPNGEWLLFSTERFDPDCDGWACLTLLPSDLASYEVIRAGSEAIHAYEVSAISSTGDLIVYPGENGLHSTDLWAIRREGSGWSDPLLLTADSPYAYNSQPAIDENGQAVVFDCGPEPYGQDGTEICFVRTNGSDFRVIVPLDPTPPEGSGSGSALNHADFVYGTDLAAPELVFEGDWGGELIWRLAPGADEPALINGAYTNDNSPCVLPDGRIASLWLNRPENPPGYHELKVMGPDGSDYFMLVVDTDVLDTGLGCGGGP